MPAADERLPPVKSTRKFLLHSNAIPLTILYSHGTSPLVFVGVVTTSYQMRGPLFYAYGLHLLGESPFFIVIVAACFQVIASGFVNNRGCVLFAAGNLCNAFAGAEGNAAAHDCFSAGGRCLPSS